LGPVTSTLTTTPPRRTPAILISSVTMLHYEAFCSRISPASCYFIFPVLSTHNTGVCLYL
jgi:hypothetical protein